MSVPPESIASASYILIHCIIDDYKQPKRWWRHRLYEEKSGSSLMSSLKFQSVSGHYKNFTRMHPSEFEYIINLIGPKIHKRNTIFRESISVQDRLAITLRFLASGDSYTSLQYLFRVSKQAISSLIIEVCNAIIMVLKDTVKIPTNDAEWVEVSKNFMRQWNFPNTVGAMDGKHVILQCPFNSSTDFYNYKKGFSIVLLAIVDADYNFMYAHVGSQGRISDGGVLQSCSLYNLLENRQLNLPHYKCLPNRNKPLPHILLADSAFPMKENIMKPYARVHPKGTKERVFNYRHSRARRVVENAFGILASVFRLLRKPMLLQPDRAEIIIMTIIHLHNFLRCGISHSFYTPVDSLDSEDPTTGELRPGTWRNDTEMTSFLGLNAIPRRSAEDLKKNREELAEYFLKEGKLCWQDNYA